MRLGVRARVSVCGPRASREDDWRRASELGGEPDAHLARVRFGLGLGLGPGLGLELG